MTQPNKPGPSWEKEGLRFKACRINGEAYVELFEGKNCLALIKTYASERKEWWPGIYEDACKEAERLNEQLRSRAQERGVMEMSPEESKKHNDAMLSFFGDEKAAAPGEESWEKLREQAFAEKEKEWRAFPVDERDFNFGFDAAVNLIARPLQFSLKAKTGFAKKCVEERDSARAEVASLRADLAEATKGLEEMICECGFAFTCQPCQLLTKLKAGRKEG